MALDPKRLAEIRGRERVATPGKWFVFYEEDRPQDVVGGIYHIPPLRDSEDIQDLEAPFYRYETRICETDSGHYGPRKMDAEFIAHARQDVPDLLDEVERLRGLLEAEGHDADCPRVNGTDTRCYCRADD